MVVEKIKQKDWSYTLYRSDNGYVLSVLCGTVGMYELNIPLTEIESARYLHTDEGLEELANIIRSSPNTYSSRSVQIEEGEIPRETPATRIPAGSKCPEEGWWFTPAKLGSRRLFKVGEVFPAIEGSAYGETFWLRDQT